MSDSMFFNNSIDFNWGGASKIFISEDNDMSSSTKVTKSLAEFESVVDVYERNGYKVKSKTENEATLQKKTRTKKWHMFKPASLVLFKLVVSFCTLFVVPILYNVLHTKKETVVVKLDQ